MSERREPGEFDDRRRAQERLRAIVEGTAAKTGEAFFRSLVRHLAAALGVKYVFVGEVDLERPERVRTLAAWAVDGFSENFEYALTDTPCERVVTRTLCFHPKGVQQLFPRDPQLRELGAESYLGTPLFDSSGRVLGLLVAIDDGAMDEDPEGRDLCRIFASRAGVELERQRAEAAVRESENRGRLIIETTLDAVITIDPESHITGWNTRAETIFGWSQEEATGQDLAELIIPLELRDAHRRGVDHFLATGEGPVLGRRIEIEGLHRSGKRFPVELAIATIRTGDSYEFSAFIQDISERKSAEEERRRLEAQIQYAQRLESLGVLAGGIAHDFNNLLTGILTNAGVARRQLTPDHPAHRSLSEVIQGSKVASHLTEQLLDYAGRGQIQRRPLDLSAEVATLEALLRTSVRERARLELDLADDLPAVEADPAQIQQVLMNLAINAAESSESPVQIRIRTRVAALEPHELPLLVPGSPLEAGRHVALEVEDDGRGLNETTQRRIFDPFFTTKSTGRGLGLAATLGIVHKHGGGIRVRSSPGAGSRFQIFFPASDRPVEAIVEQGDLELCGSGRVLVVDDDEYVLRAVRASLESYGYSVLVAESGERAVALFRELDGEIDLVVLDLIMPGIGGEETFRALRTIRPDLKALLSTGYDNSQAARRFADDDLAGVLRKPFEPDDLAAEVKRLLGHPGRRGASAEFEREFDALRTSYREKLPTSLGELESAVRRARSADDVAQSWEAAFQLAHRLKGTAGSYGFEALADSLEVVETTLDRMIEQGCSGDADWTTIQEAMARAQASLRR